METYYPIRGDVLDYGGGEKAHYRKIIQCDSYKSVNIDSGIDPTYIINAGEPVPCRDMMFDAILSLNTLEYVFDALFVLKELFRVLKPGGQFFLSVPFLAAIHDHPVDFFRPTHHWYQHALSLAGFKNIQIFPLYWGPATTRIYCVELSGPARYLRWKMALFADFIYMRVRCFLGKMDISGTSPLGYFISAEK
jgi:SAM-dependent methyltransferase